MWMSRWIAVVKSRWDAVAKSGCLMPVVLVVSCVGVCQYDMHRKEQQKGEELSRQRAADPCRLDDAFRRAHPNLDSLEERHSQELTRLHVQQELSALELKADEIRSKLLEPEDQVHRAIQRGDLFVKLFERHRAQFDALSRMHEAEWKAACEAAIADSRRTTSEPGMTGISP